MTFRDATMLKCLQSMVTVDQLNYNDAQHCVVATLKSASDDVCQVTSLID